jgi:tetratricopeptide (TPR) repeat protein
MPKQASILLLLILILLPSRTNAGSVAGSFDADLKEAVQKNDWPEIVMLLNPKSGQNFEHDLILAKSLLQLERRAEALKVLNTLYPNHREDRVVKLLQLAGSIFFNQETSNLYFEGVRLVAARKFAEAKEKFDQANAKEPSHVLVLTRLVEIELVLGQTDQATRRLKEALLLAPQSPELKLFSIKIALLTDEATKGESLDSVGTLKKPYPIYEAPFLLVIEFLKRTGRSEELKTIAEDFLKAHPTWVTAQVWFYKSGLLSAKQMMAYKTQIDRALKARDRFDSDLEKEMSRSQYLWVGYTRFDDLVNDMR